MAEHDDTSIDRPAFRSRGANSSIESRGCGPKCHMPEAGGTVRDRVKKCGLRRNVKAESPCTHESGKGQTLFSEEGTRAGAALGVRDRLGAPAEPVQQVQLKPGCGVLRERVKRKGKGS